MRILRVGMDFHRTIVNIQPILQKLIRQMYGKEIPENEIQRRIVVDQKKILTHKQYEAVLNALYKGRRPPILEAPEYPGARNAIYHHVGQRDKVTIITKSGKDAFRGCIAWCEDRYWDSNILGICGPDRNGSKRELIRMFNLDTYTDDDWEILQEVRDAEELHAHPILMRRPYQHTKGDISRISVVENFEHYIRKIEKIRTQRSRRA